MTAVSLTAELDAIEAEEVPIHKGKRLEAMISNLFGLIPGMSIDGHDVVNAYRTEEIDLIFWNEQHENGFRFLDCPLIVECKGWSRPVSGREVRYFATELKDKGRRNGIFVALKGITCSNSDLI